MEVKATNLVLFHRIHYTTKLTPQSQLFLRSVAQWCAFLLRIEDESLAASLTLLLSKDMHRPHPLGIKQNHTLPAAQVPINI